MDDLPTWGFLDETDLRIEANGGKNARSMVEHIAEIVYSRQFGLDALRNQASRIVSMNADQLVTFVTECNPDTPDDLSRYDALIAEMDEKQIYRYEQSGDPLHGVGGADSAQPEGSPDDDQAGPSGPREPAQQPPPKQRLSSDSGRRNKKRSKDQTKYVGNAVDLIDDTSSG